MSIVYHRVYKDASLDPRLSQFVTTYFSRSVLNVLNFVRFEVLAAAKVSMFFMVMTPCGLLGGHCVGQ
jgi:hypothetical protein